jgi:TrmH family RNA methyltransferase
MLAKKGGYEIETILFVPDICSEKEAQKLSKSAELIEINTAIFQN